MTETRRVTLTVGQVAERLGVTVRTLHHYDEIGLVVPSGRSSAGYRLYTDEDLARLQHVVVYRRLVVAIDRALEREMTKQPATPDDLRQLFGEGFEDAQSEAEERWGETDAWRQSRDRTKGYTRADWEEVKAESDRTHRAFTDAMDAGEPPTGERAMDAAELHRGSMRRFYDCGYEMHRNLADLYVSDARFTATYDEIRPGMARYVRDAIHANADRHEA